MQSNFILSFLALGAFCTTAHAGITFGPIRGKAGESIRLVATTETPGGTLQETVAGKSRKGSILISRERDLVWTFRDPAADGSRRGMVKVSEISTSTRTVIDGKSQTTNDPSALTGKMFAMSRPARGEWKFELDGSIPLTRVKEEIDELKVYLKRDWYPDHEVNLGDSWEFDPAWIKMTINRDYSSAQTIGTMRLRQIRNTLTRKLAVIDVSIRSTGAKFQADGNSGEISVDLAGQITVNLDTMLDESLELRGTVTTNTRRSGQITNMNLPIRIVATKSFVRDRSFP